MIQKISIRFLALISLIMLEGCMSINIDNYKDESPAFDFKEYFNGPLKAYGIVQGWRGNVVTRFDLDMVGSWDGDKGKLEEDFRYYNGKTQRRVWHINRISDKEFTGTADDILTEATGAVNGNAVRWNYLMDLDVDGTTYRIKFDDWMWRMNDGVVINRSYMKKFGITVAEITIFIQKQSP